MTTTRDDGEGGYGFSDEPVAPHQQRYMDLTARIRWAIESYIEGRWHEILGDLDAQELAEHLTSVLNEGKT